MKTKTGKIILSAAALLFSAASACIGMGLLGASGAGFWLRFLMGFFFMGAPLLVVQLVIELFRKSK